MPWHKSRILAVDNEPTGVKLLKAILLPVGYEVIEAYSGQEALEKIALGNIDLVLLDIMMPGMDGFEVTRRIREDENTRFIPIVLLTALNDIEDRVTGIEAGCDDFISKPFDRNEILARVKMLVTMNYYRQQMEEKEKDALEYSESVLNTVREPLIVLDQDLKVVSGSRAFYEVFQVNPGETVGQLIYDLGNRQWDIPKLRELLETILPQKASFDNYEVEHDFSTIGKRIMLLNARQIQRGMGKERIILLAIEDITQRKAVEKGLEKAHAELEFANKGLEAFSYTLSHDLRNPLTAVGGYAWILNQEYGDIIGTKGKEIVEGIISNSDKMTQLINDMLDLARINRTEMKWTPVNLSEMVTNLKKENQQREPDRQVEFAIAENLLVKGDENLLKIAIENLFNNAWKFTSKRTVAKIEISAVQKENETVYFIKDNGAGFDSTHAQKMFMPFQRFHASSDFQGTGVGLSIVQSVIQRHNGRIWAESVVDQGTTFFFTIPTP
jgi:two-component system cell cycle sensor histidine kinase PleC